MEKVNWFGENIVLDLQIDQSLEVIEQISLLLCAGLNIQFAFS